MYSQWVKLTGREYITNPAADETVQICSRVCTTVKGVKI